MGPPIHTVHHLIVTPLGGVTLFLTTMFRINIDQPTLPKRNQ